MRRLPNLSSRPFENRRLVLWVAAALAVIGIVLTVVNVNEIVTARDREVDAAARITSLENDRKQVVEEVEELNRKLRAVGWKRIQQETASLQGVIAERRFAWTMLLVDLERTLPWDIRLISISPQLDSQRRVDLKLTGIAVSRAAWLGLLETLFTDGKFSEPVPESEEAPGVGSPQGHRFALRAVYWPEGRP